MFLHDRTCGRGRSMELSIRDQLLLDTSRCYFPGWLLARDFFFFLIKKGGSFCVNNNVYKECCNSLLGMKIVGPSQRNRFSKFVKFLEPPFRVDSSQRKSGRSPVILHASDLWAVYCFFVCEPRVNGCYVCKYEDNGRKCHVWELDRKVKVLQNLCALTVISWLLMMYSCISWWNFVFCDDFQNSPFSPAMVICKLICFSTISSKFQKRKIRNVFFAYCFCLSMTVIYARLSYINLYYSLCY